jgi:hypothetical protein
MRNRIFVSSLISTAAVITFGALTTGSAFAIKKAPYTEVKIEIAEAFQPDAAFNAARKAFSEAVASKNADALFSLVGPSFVWIIDGALSSDFDPGRNAVDNFKIVAGFRAAGADHDGGVEGGPFWEALASYAAEGTFYKVPDATNLYCSPTLAEATGEDALDKANAKLESGDDAPEWYFTVSADTPVMATPDGKGAPVGKLGKVAVPVLSMHPPQEGDNPPKATHYEILLPSGKSGWIPVAAVLPMVTNRMCYGKNSAGEWKIVLFDQAEE